MLITHEEMRAMNRIQTDILREVAAVCKALNLQFFMVHGSLLGTVRNHGFIPDDDDIDICMPRKDYEIFMKEAQRMLPKNLFVQNHMTDTDYPLEFGKVRDNDTTYIVEVSKHIRMNHGMFIDVFPLDYIYTGKWKKKAISVKCKLLNMRLTSAMELQTTPAKKAVRFIAKVLYPNYHKAQRSLDRLNSGASKNETLKITGGKLAERALPEKWFFPAKKDIFEGIEVYIPSDSEAYLTHIYGDYKNRTLLENKHNDDHYIEVNACVVDTKKPYTSYINIK